MADLDRIVTGIAKSGFVLEHRVSDILRGHKWSVINNKYYLDDVQESAREIDLIAYKVARHADFLVYTALIVSCKKSEDNAWAFLMRDRDMTDPNIDWYPIKAWSNETVLKHILTGDWRTAYLDELHRSDTLRPLVTPTGHLFAFQEVDKKRGTVQNDKNIFNAVSSLMKAEAYELGRLEQRKKTPAVYTFNLVSVADTELVTLRFVGNTITPEEAQEARFVFNYIVNRGETASRIHFVTAPAFDTAITAYDELHENNVRFFDGLFTSFYTHVFRSVESYGVLRDTFTSRVKWVLEHEYRNRFGRSPSDEKIYFSVAEDKVLEIEIFYDDTDTEFLQQNDRVRERFATALKSIYRYEGPFRFATAEVPF